MRMPPIVALLVLPIWLSSPSLAQPPVKKLPGEEIPETLKKAVLEAERLTAKRDELGKALLHVLLDVNQSRWSRGQAARALGKLRYRAAIPRLIEHIGLEDWPSSKWEKEPSPIEEGYPCIAALMDFGLEAVPQLLDAYLAERNELRRTLLGVPFTKVNAKVVRIYAQGIAFDKGDPFVKHQVAQLIRDLRTVSEDVTWPLKWDVKP